MKRAEHVLQIQVFNVPTVVLINYPSAKFEVDSSQQTQTILDC